MPLRVPSRVVLTRCGPVRGERLLPSSPHSVDAFKGLPYAAPPIGELRFRRPQPPKSWTSVRKCTKFARRCVQRDYFLLERIMKRAGSEDCLYLNVFTPVWEAPPGGFPVLVFIHGGSFCIHDTATYGDIGIASNLVSKGLVVVTIQYRLGYLGFFSTGDEFCPGNIGLWDQTAALQWVADNIEAFNGNANNVTVAGQSAGAVCADLLSLSPHSRHLFHNVVLLSGAATAEWAIIGDMAERSRRKAERLGVVASSSRELLSSLRRVPASWLGAGLGPEEGTEDEAVMRCSFAVGPVVDGSFLPFHPRRLRAEAPSKPRLAGITQLEAALFLGNFTPTTGRLRKIVDGAIPRTLPDREEVVGHFLHSYLQSGAATPRKQLRRAFTEAYGDRMMNGPVMEMISTSIVHSKGESAVFSYLFKHFNPRSIGFLSFLLPFKESTHCTELDFLFGKGIVWPYKFSEDDLKMLSIFTTAISNFAKCGDPNGSVPSLPIHWPPASLSSPETHFVFETTPRLSESLLYGRPRQMAELRSEANDLNLLDCPHSTVDSSKETLFV